MFGAVLVFVGVLMIVFTFMSIAHSFLRESEDPIDEAREAQYRQQITAPKPEPRHHGQPQYAH